MKKIAEQKLQAFAIGAMGQRPLSRREQEERRKREEEQAAASVFKEFVETFEEAPSSVAKVWVKAGTYDAGSRKEDNKEKGKLYKPQAQAKHDEKPIEKSNEQPKLQPTPASSAAAAAKKEAAAKKNKAQEKKKSNLELFKEELRQMQEEREERTKYKTIAKSMIQADTTLAAFTREPDAPPTTYGSMDNGDPNTTNIYLGNLSPKITEQQLMEIFGRYGPLASIKIMWPRSEEEKQRGRNCGFVAYMSRLDAERALRCLNGRDVMGYEMKLGWGKSVSIMTYPIYIPPTLMQHYMPPPPSGLPFNAQPQPNEAENFPPPDYFHDYNKDPDIKRDMEELAYKSIVKVMIPTERPLLALIHRMIEFVIREGPMFEAMIMSKEIDNPTFRFLFENESPAHIYYRWKLFSLLQGDTPTEWRQKEFRMFQTGSIWKPPPLNFYTQGMPEELIVDDEAPEIRKGTLSTAQRDRLEDLIRHLTPERSKIGDCMVFCIEHADAADEICECIEESMSNTQTLISKKIARLYLVSDILHNCTVKVSNASFYRTSMEKYLEEIFKHLNATYKSLESRLKAEGFKARVVQVLKAWDEWLVYDRDFINKLKTIYLGIQHTSEKREPEPEPLIGSGDEKEDEDLDGVPLDGAALLKSAFMRGIPGAATSVTDSPSHERVTLIQENVDSEYEDDIDGIPLEDPDIDGIPIGNKDQSPVAAGFIPSKWETVDPEKIEAQAITTSKWETLETQPTTNLSEDSFDSFEYSEGTRDYDEEKRLRLREVELKTVQYQDELESGNRSLKSGWSVQQQCEHYRRKLMKRSLRELQTDSPHSGRTSSLKRSPSPTDSLKKSKKSKRSPSPQYNRNTSSRRRSRSPGYSKRIRDSISPSTRYRKHRRSRSRSSSHSPKRYNDRSLSPSSRSSKYESNRRYHRSPSPVSTKSYEKSSSRHMPLSPNRYTTSKRRKHHH
ncbi:U2 snRNP-associated SURP motif-containing protein [Contarinia nasturtii]|uniref:U2 snRNP-associated SURP motif-containing protein n=1 Tax=Contarinia nasturtii TaxID=265458 RepID=UPI0012D3D689|nr:U2 snRNP-associated SURP motif-containing protein [Contarinia nasturtii]